MKKVLFPLLLLLLAFSTHAQTDKNSYPKTISVTGSAEMEIVPDEIYVQVDLKEYDKKGSGKVSIDKIRQQFLQSAKAVGIPDSAISIAAYDGWNGNPWLRKKNKKEELYASIAYQVKLRSSQQLDELVNRLDDEATQNFFIQRTAHSQIEALRKQLKIAAVKAAKEKAQYLTAAINEKLGEAVTINEPTEHFIPYYNQYKTSNTMIRQGAEAMGATTDTAPVDFRKIKLKYDVTVVFAL